MLSLQAEAVTVEPNGRGTPKMPADGHAWRCRAGTTSHRGRSRREASLLELFEDGREGYSAPESAPAGCPSGECRTKGFFNIAGALGRGILERSALRNPPRRINLQGSCWLPGC